jgi:hypothetical protein
MTDPVLPGESSAVVASVAATAILTARPPLPSISGSALLESQRLLHGVGRTLATWLTKG